MTPATHASLAAGLLAIAVASCASPGRGDAEPLGAAAPAPWTSTPWTSAGPLKTILTPAGTTDTAVRGVWRSRGYGWILDIGKDGITRYQTDGACYAPPRGEGALSEMDSVHYRYFRMMPGGGSAIFQLLDGDTNVVFDRLPALPADCTRQPDTAPQAVAADFLAAFRKNYAFFDRRPPGYAERAARTQRLIRPGMTEAELWDALGAFMHGLSDSHTKLIGKVDGEKRRVQDGQGTTLPRIRAGKGGEQHWLTALLGQTKDGLGPTAHTAGGGRIVWGVIDGRIGYLQIFVMGGFTDRTDFASPDWARAEMNALNSALDKAFAAFRGTDAVIVDLSNNRGGWDRVAKALPGRFTDKPYTGFTTQARGSGLAPFPNVIRPADGPRYSGSVYLMTSDITVSGGELATLAFRQLPQVTQVGTTTRGAYSTPLAKPLPNGWLLELSNETFAAPDGTVYEETGIAPDIRMDIYPADDPVGGHWRAVKAVARMAEEASGRPQTTGGNDQER
ncbi:S41 family peptidase [Novosphingobium sp. ZN18A2]|uniref:S41 family peptidase n=1 Tax=Novosphingobium sp. ZN18A2 TaxID=3079861 RepID=UPI0030D4BC5C